VEEFTLHVGLDTCQVKKKSKRRGEKTRKVSFNSTNQLTRLFYRKGVQNECLRNHNRKNI